MNSASRSRVTTIISYSQARVSSGSARLYRSSAVGRPSGPIRLIGSRSTALEFGTPPPWHNSELASPLDGSQQTRTRATRRVPAARLPRPVVALTLPPLCARNRVLRRNSAPTKNVSENVTPRPRRYRTATVSLQTGLSSDEHQLHLSRALSDLEDLAVAVMPGHREFVHEPVAAEDLRGVAGVVHGRL